MAVETVEIQERYTKRVVRAVRQEESNMASCLRQWARSWRPYCARSRMIRNKGNNGRRAGSRHASGKPTWSVTLAIRRVTSPDHHHHHQRTVGKRATEGPQAVGNGLYLQGRIADSKVSFLVDTGFGASQPESGGNETDQGTN